MFGSMKSRLIGVIVGTSILSILILGAFFTYTIISDNETQLKNYRRDLEASVEASLKGETEIAVSLINEFYKKQQAGELTEEQAKKAAADAVRDLRYDDGKGYFWVDTDEGINVVLLGRDTEGKSRINAKDPSGRFFIQEMIANGKKPGGGFTDLQFAKPGETEPLPKRNYTTTFEPYHWVLGTGVWIDQIDAQVAQREAILNDALRKDLISMFVMLIVLVVLFAFVAVYIANGIATPLEKITERIRVMSTGDLRLKGEEKVELEAFAERSDEIGVMASAMGDMQAKIVGLMERIVEAAEYVAAASEELTSTADQATEVSQSIAESVVSVAGSCSEQFTDVESANENTQKLAENMDRFKDTIIESEEKIEATSDAAQVGRDNVQNAVKGMEKINENVQNLSSVVGNLGEQSKKIGSIVDTISAISEQTNLLALNAAIEAARAGEHGRGFAVVADEVRKLAEQSNGAASEISALIDSIQKETESAVTAMEAGVEQVTEGSKAVDGAGASFGEISNMVTKVAASSKTMASIVEELATSTDSIKDSIEKINEMSRKVSNEAQTVSAATEEQSASMHEIADASRKLAEQAQDLQNVVVEFKI